MQPTKHKTLNGMKVIPLTSYDICKALDIDAEMGKVKPLEKSRESEIGCQYVAIFILHLFTVKFHSYIFSFSCNDIAPLTLSPTVGIKKIFAPNLPSSKVIAGKTAGNQPPLLVD